MWLLAVFVGMSVSASPAFGHDGYDDKRLLTMSAWMPGVRGWFRRISFQRREQIGQTSEQSRLCTPAVFVFFPEASVFGQIYPTAYQGVGVAWNTFFDPEEMGSPAAVYVFRALK